MQTKYFDINANGHSIKCKLYYTDIRSIRRAVLFGHGFGGHKDNKAAERFADHALSKYKNIAVMTFNWPCHGDDVKKKLSLRDCDEYLELCIDYLKNTIGAGELYGYATSFGGYMFLKRLSEKGSPFVRTALRCPAVKMYDDLHGRAMSGEDAEKLAKGKDIMLGFDRKIRVSQSFFDELAENEIFTRDFMDFADEILILQGTKDEIVSFEDVYAFAERNLIDFEAVENADHRFKDPNIMDAAIYRILDYYRL